MFCQPGDLWVVLTCFDRPKNQNHGATMDSTYGTRTRVGMAYRCKKKKKNTDTKAPICEL